MLDDSHLLISIVATVQCDSSALRPCFPSCAGLAVVMSAVWTQCKRADLAECKWNVGIILSKPYLGFNHFQDLAFTCRL